MAPNSPDVHIRFQARTLHEDSVSLSTISPSHAKHPDRALCFLSLIHIKFTRRPRTMFWCQVVATIIAGTVQIGVQTWMFDSIEGICDPRQPQYFSCPNTEVFYTASIVWGVVGPGLQFTKGKIYSWLLFAFLFGTIVPMIPWVMTKKYPNGIFRYVKCVSSFTRCRSCARSLTVPLSHALVFLSC